METRKQHGENACSLRCDLHTHSVFSDGTYTPGEIVAEAKRLGLIVALTDHNTAAGLSEFMDAAHRLGVTAVPGVEFSTEYKGKELHLLGLFVFPEHYAVVERMVKEQHVLKEISNMELVERLRDESSSEVTGLINVSRRVHRKFGGNSGIFLTREKQGQLTTKIRLDQIWEKENVKNKSYKKCKLYTK